MPADTTETVVQHSARLQPSINLHAPVTAFYVQLLWYPMYYPGGMKARVSPVQWSKPHSILVPTQDLNQGGRMSHWGMSSEFQRGEDQLKCEVSKSESVLECYLAVNCPKPTPKPYLVNFSISPGGQPLKTPVNSTLHDSKSLGLSE